MFSSQAYVLSSHRVYVSKADTFELSDTICGKGEAVTLFLFNDSLEVRFIEKVKSINSGTSGSRSSEEFSIFSYQLI